MSQDQKDALHTDYVKFGAASPAAPGWKMVPAESTSAMDHAGWDALPGGCQMIDAERCYLAMLGAAPAAPVEPVITAPRVEDVKPWAIRQSESGYHRNAEACMLEEIADLRAHLARQAQPTDRDSILEEAAMVAQEHADGTNGSYRTACHNCATAIRHLIWDGKSGSGSPAADGWISVDERLPGDDGPVLVWEKYSSAPFVGWWNGRAWGVSGEHITVHGDGRLEDNISQELITHWMPKPEAPGKSGSASEGAAE